MEIYIPQRACIIPSPPDSFAYINMALKFVVILLPLLAAVNAMKTGPKVWPDEEETIEYWTKKAQVELEKALEAEKVNKNMAKNVILLLGDGMGIPTIAAGRILKGQLEGGLGEESTLAMDKLPRVGLSKTYSLDRQTSDSAATATAYLCGVKSIDATIGLAGKVRRGDCQSSKGQEVESVLIDAFHAGKSTGVITTTHLGHATIAGAYAHAADRNWYSDADMPQAAKDGGCKDIALQFLESSDKITVALGGGRQYFRPTNASDEAVQIYGSRTDGRDLVQEWIDSPTDEVREFVWNKDQFNAVDPRDTDRILGMFGPKYMDYEVDRDPNQQPSIAEMTEKAIKILRKNTNGYFLLVEGGRIDHGHHSSSAIEALNDMVAFDGAVEKAMEMTSEEDTLLIVTADHSHTMSIGGYSHRGTSVFGFAAMVEEEMIDTKPATSILYGDGPGYLGNGTLEKVTLNPNARFERENLTLIDTASRNYHQQSGVPRTSESHAGDDVAIFARGPMAHLFHGVHEQSYIPHVIRFAACLNSTKVSCPSTSLNPDNSVSFLGIEHTSSQASVALYVEFVLLICMTLFAVFLAIALFRSRMS